MEMFIRVVLKIINFPNSEYSHGAMEDTTKGNGEITQCTEKEYLPGRMGRNSKASIKMTRRKAKEGLS